MRKAAVSGFLIMILAMVCISCYTTFRAPRSTAADDDSGVQQSAAGDEAMGVYLNPSLPDARWRDYDWLYYFQSAWWMDEPYDHWGAGGTARPDPEEYRQRFPQGSYPDGSTVTAPSATYSAPGLSKGSETVPSPGTDPASNDPQRRDFNSGSHATPSTPAPAATGSNNNNQRGFEAGSHTKTDDKQSSTTKRK